MTLFDRLDPSSYTLPEDLTSGLMSPALVIYMARVRENIQSVLQAAGGDPERWRPHVKTTKIPEVWVELVRAGVRNFKCATTREAELLLRTLDAEGQHGDVLLAYPLIGPALRRLGDIADHHPGSRVSVLCEDPDLVVEVPRQLSIFVDVNPGMDRTGVRMVDDYVIHAIAQAAGERLRGLHYYDGHLHDENLADRRSRIHSGYEAVLELHSALVQGGHTVGEIITAGTPAFLNALEYWSDHTPEGTQQRVSPGTVVFHDATTEEQNPDLRLMPAALVFARVVSRPTPQIATCDAGSKAIAAEAGDPIAHVLGRPRLEALTPNEEHLPLRIMGGRPPDRGDELLLIPRHVCPTVNLADEAVLLEEGGAWKIVPVAARGHEMIV